MRALARELCIVMDFALRMVESTAFGLHSMIGMTDPCHGIGRSLTEDSLPRWFFPVAGVCLALVALANFSGQSALVLGAQAYVAAFHSGGVYLHWRLRHHPVAGGAPGLFVFFAAAVAALRTNLWIALLGTTASAALGVLLGSVLVRPGRAANSDVLFTEM